MRAQRIKKGFHRLGIVIAVLCTLLAVLVLVLGIGLYQNTPGSRATGKLSN